ncbi:hypothetical protein YC2023_067779 [Brassica napus]
MRHVSVKLRPLLSRDEHVYSQCQWLWSSPDFISFRLSVCAVADLIPHVSSLDSLFAPSPHNRHHLILVLINQPERKKILGNGEPSCSSVAISLSLLSAGNRTVARSGLSLFRSSQHGKARVYSLSLVGNRLVVATAGRHVNIRRDVFIYCFIWFRPRVLVDVSKIDTSTSILGYPISAPKMKNFEGLFSTELQPVKVQGLKPWPLVHLMLPLVGRE